MADEEKKKPKMRDLYKKDDDKGDKKPEHKEEKKPDATARQVADSATVDIDAKEKK